MEHIHSSDFEKQFLRRRTFWRLHQIPHSPLPSGVHQLQWFQTDSIENFNRRGNHAFTPGSIEYTFNSLGYRGEEFEVHNEEDRVLFFGDSHTFGLGMPFTSVWTSLVATHLSKLWGCPVRQMNFAWGGAGTDHTAMLIHQVAEMLCPSAVFVLWSFAGRMSWFPESDQQVFFLPSRFDRSPRHHRAYIDLRSDAQSFFSYVRNVNFACDRLFRLGIPFLWGNLENFTMDLLAQYVPLDGYVGSWDKADTARDGLHGGILSHERFADKILSRCSCVSSKRQYAGRTL